MSPQGASPVPVGVLYDFPQHDGGRSFEEALTLGLRDVTSTGRFDRDVELVVRHAQGLPAGSVHDVELKFDELARSGVLCVIGPSVSDNGLVVRDLADASQVPCVNYTGGERTRSAWMFHYQVGSLEEEPELLVEHIAGRGLPSAAVAYDHSPVGRRYAEVFAGAAGRRGVDVVASHAVSPLAEDLSGTVARLTRSEPSCLAYLGLGVAARAMAVAIRDAGWDVDVVANSSLMFGYARRDWRSDWEGWTYVDTVSDDNAERLRLKEISPKTAAGPVGVAAYDIGRLLAEALARAEHLTRSGVREALESVKRLPASSGLQGTTMGFGVWDHAALKGPYLVLRRWENERTVQADM